MSTPIIDLTELFGLSGRGDAPGRLLGKLETANHTGSVKDRPVERMLRDPRVAGAHTLVEATGGNTGISLAVAGSMLGKRVIVTMSRKMSPGKVRQMEEAGAEVILCPLVGLDSPANFINVARQLGEAEGHWYVDQFNNPANVEAHYETTGPELLEQVRDLDAFVAGAGTGGTLTGAGRALKERNPGIDVVLADPAGSTLGPHLRGEETEPAPYLVEGIGGDFLPPLLDFGVLDTAYQVDDAEAAAHLRTLAAAAIDVGSSSGTTVGAALAYLRDHPGATVCALLADSGDRYAETWRNQAWLTDHGL
ncbi:cysteine synthase family protein [Flexivirga sp. ID2601S]|uniref:Cysteine synthase family protein n=1 Tax=Flexivirga aerilata TaxID=1656889 RepID=A0A849AAY5_9MICO|nr:cysteine synthase family protein [Flexivirga aerilata]